MSWVRHLVQLLVTMLAAFPALSFAAAYGYELVPVASHCSHATHLHAAMDRSASAALCSHEPGKAPHAGDTSGHHAGYDRNCCDACQIAAGLIVAVIEPVATPRGIRVVRLSEVTPPGELASTPSEPPRS